MYKSSNNESSLSVLFAVIIVIIVCIISVFAYKYFTDQSEWKGLITEKRWHYEQDVKVFTPVRDGCFSRGCTPYGSYDIREEWKDTKKDRWVGQRCKPGTKNGGTPTIDCVDIYEDIYDWYQNYTQNRWVVNYTVYSDGNRNEPFFAPLNITRQFGDKRQGCNPNYDPNGSMSLLLGCQTAGDQRTNFYFSVNSYEPIVMNTECPTSYEGWKDYRIEENLSGKYWTHQSKIDCQNITRTSR